MDRPALVILMFDNTKAEPWLGLFEGPEQQENIRASGNMTLVRLAVTSYSLTDHQFVGIKMKVRDKEVVVQIPRGLVLTVLEGADESLGKGKHLFGFGAAKSK